MSKYPPGTDCNSMQNDIDTLTEELEGLYTQMYLMSNIVASAISDLEDIADAKPQTYADTLENVLKRPRIARRPMTMKDAKRMAKFNAKQLRKVWDFLDPTDQAK